MAPTDLQVGMPILLFAAGILFIMTGWPLVVLLVVLPPAIAILVVSLWARRQPRIAGWDEENIYLRFLSRSETVSWGRIEYFAKLWVTHKLEGGGKAWVAILIKYRTHNTSRRTLLTVGGAAAVYSQPLLPGKYETVFDRRIPQRNWTRR
jgi:hypothetical protein